MDAYGNHFTYSSHEQNYERCPYASNFEEGQNQDFDQRYYEDERYNGYDQCYDDGRYYEDRMHSYNQQVTCNEGYGQWSEQPSYYREELCYPYTSSYDDSQRKYDEDSYDQCYSSHQFSGESSNSRHKIEYLEEKMNEFQEFQAQQAEMMDEILALQKEISKNLEVIQAQQAEEVENNQEARESHEDQLLENSLEVPDQVLEEGSDEVMDYIRSFLFTPPTDDEDSTMGDCIRDMFSTPPIEDELEHYHEDAPEGDDLEPRGLDLHEDFVEEHIDLDEEQPCTQETMSEEKDVELRTPKSQIQIIKDWTSVESWSSVEDPYLFTLSPSKFWSFRPFMDAPIEWNSYGPSVFKEVNLSRGPDSQNDIHCRLDGRKFK